MKPVITVTALQTPIIETKTGVLTGQWLKWFSAVQQFLADLTFADVNGILDAAQLPANVPVVSFGTTPPGSATEGDIFFNTLVSPYQGFVFHSGAWHQFS